MAVLLSFVVCNMACAQTPSANMMPDGSHDMYLGIGIESLPRFEGSGEQRTQAVPALQMQWSSGLFVAGLSAGMHLSSTSDIEYGPLLAIEPGRKNASVQAVYVGASNASSGSTDLAGATYAYANINEVGPRIEAGGFFNFYLSDKTRVATSMLYGAGENRNGLIALADIQQSFHPATHHSLSLVAGLSWANKSYMQSYFGVPPDSIATSLDGAYAYLQDGYEPGGGIKDVHLALHWNWTLSNDWLLISQVAATRLEGDAAASQLATRRDNVTVSSAIAYRF